MPREEAIKMLLQPSLREVKTTLFFKQSWIAYSTKERGHYCMRYMYVTVFIRNAANLTHL
jgi:hypothetical protein